MEIGPGFTVFGENNIAGGFGEVVYDAPIGFRGSGKQKGVDVQMFKDFFKFSARLMIHVPGKPGIPKAEQRRPGIGKTVFAKLVFVYLKNRFHYKSDSSPSARAVSGSGLPV
jgi:hypothetical protein